MNKDGMVRTQDQQPPKEASSGDCGREQCCKRANANSQGALDALAARAGKSCAAPHATPQVPTRGN